MNPFDSQSTISIPPGDIRLQAAYINFLANQMSQQQQYENQLALLREQNRLQHNPWVEGSQAFLNPVMTGLTNYLTRQTALDKANIEASSNLARERLQQSGAADVARIKGYHDVEVAGIPGRDKAKADETAFARQASGLGELGQHIFQPGSPGNPGMVDPFSGDQDFVAPTPGRQRMPAEIMSRMSGPGLAGLVGSMSPKANEELFSNLNPLTAIRAMADIGKVGAETQQIGREGSLQGARAEEILANIAAGKPYADVSQTYSQTDLNRATTAGKNVDAQRQAQVNQALGEIQSRGMEAFQGSQGLELFNSPAGRAFLATLGIKTNEPDVDKPDKPTTTSIDLALARDIASREPGFSVLSPEEQDLRTRVKFHEIQLSKVPTGSVTRTFDKDDPFQTRTIRERPDDPVAPLRSPTASPRPTAEPSLDMPRPQHPNIDQMESLVRSAGGIDGANRAIDATRLPAAIKGYLKSYAKQFYRAK